MKKFVFVFIVFWSISLCAQDMLSVKKLIEQYEVKLDLTKEQASNLDLILENYNAILYKKDLDKKEFNKTNKLRDLDIYKMLTKSQFEKYKKVKLEIEPTLKFRFN